LTEEVSRKTRNTLSGWSLLGCDAM